MDKVVHFNYRKYYKEYYGINFGKEMEIHHLDGDRGNNDIYNLLLLPKKIHNTIHNAKFHFSLHTSSEYFQNGLAWLGVRRYDFLDDSIEYLRAIRESFKWFEAKREGYKNINDSRVTKSDNLSF